MTWRTAAAVMLLIAVSACTASTDGSTTTSEANASSIASPSTTSPEVDAQHPHCETGSGLESGLQPKPSILADGQTIDGAYAFGDRAICPWLIEEGTVTTLLAVDGAGVGDVEAEVPSNTQITLTVANWQDEITVSRLTWTRLTHSVAPQLQTTGAEPGTWVLEAPAEPGDWVLSLTLDWGYGTDTWGWRIKVVE